MSKLTEQEKELISLVKEEELKEADYYAEKMPLSVEEVEDLYRSLDKKGYLDVEMEMNPTRFLYKLKEQEEKQETDKDQEQEQEQEQEEHQDFSKRDIKNIAKKIPKRPNLNLSGKYYSKTGVAKLDEIKKHILDNEEEIRDILRDDQKVDLKRAFHLLKETGTRSEQGEGREIIRKALWRQYYLK